jgi:hypothetical protein
VQRFTRIAVPPNPKELKDLQDWFRRVERAITELQNLQEATTATAEDLAEEVAELEDDITSGAVPAWAVITASGDQSSIDEVATPDLVTAWDTVSDGSTGHGVTVSAITKANGGLLPSRLRAGQSLRIPKAAAGNTRLASNKSTTSKSTKSTKRFYSVRKGDNLSRIASRHDTSVATIKKLNGLRSTVVRAGQKLRVS